MTKTKICIIKTEDGFDCKHISIGREGAMIRTWPEGAQEWEEQSVEPRDAEELVRTAVRWFSNRDACLLALPELERDSEFGSMGLPLGNARWGRVFQSLRGQLKKMPLGHPVVGLRKRTDNAKSAEAFEGFISRVLPRLGRYE